ncbi:MAG: MG2 domain-containing protein, partial [Acidobacteriota bacterium]
MFALAATLRAAVTVGVALVAASAGVAQEKAMTRWQDVDRLVDEQKYQAASELTGELLGEARAAGDEAMWTRALIKSTQLRLALHGYGRAVRFLQDEPWPETPRHRLNVGLFYGHTLRTYLQAYSWEIRKREDVAGEAGEDLKTWTLDRVVQEIEETYAGIFSQREAWGEASLGEGAAYLDPGTYPAQVRGTLRDIVSYLWVDLLADTGLWRPEAQGQTYLLDLDGLLAPPQPLSESDAALLVDPAVHPVTKVRAVLADLEAWHLGQHRPEAALEARLELLRRLRASFSTHGEDRRLLRDNLTVRLATFDRGLPWFSMGLATLAEMQRSEPDDPMALARARDTARQGQSAHPDSVGGQRCAHLVSTLERPQLSLAAMAVDGDRKRSIQISHANAESVHLRAYPVDVLSTLRGKNPRWRPNQQEVTRLLGTAPAATWTQALPATPDLRSHHTYSTPPSLPRGAYVVVASLRGDFRGSGNVMSAALFLRSDLVIASRPVGDGGELEVRTVNGPDGRPRAAEVEVMRLNWRSGGQTLVRRRSEKDGRLIFATEDWQRHRHVLIARDGDDLAVQEVYGYSSGRDRQAEPRSLVYTDRSVYRPSQDIFWKVVAYRGQDDRFRTEPGDAFDVVLRDANGEEVAKERVETNEFGSASGRFTISPGRLLGSWWIEAVGRLGTARFQVEEYKRPTFEVAVDEPTSALRLNREARLIGRADYYFGLPVSDGTARWRITREPRFPPWRWWRPAASVTPRVIAHGESAVRADGTFDVIFTPQADERLADEREVSYRYSIDVEVTDGGGETREGRRSVAVGFAAIDASLQAASPFFSAEAPIVFDIARTRLSGPAAPGEGGYRIVRLVQPDETPLPSELPATDGRGDDAFRTAGDLMRPRWSAETDPRRFLRALPDGEEVASGALRHGDDGRARLELELGGGAYRLHYRSEDDFGTPVERRMDFIVRGTEALRLPLVLAPATTSVEVGDELSLLVHSGFDRQRLVLVVEGRGGRVLRQELDATEHPQLISVPITAAERGGVSVTLATVRDHQWMRQEQRVAVPYTDRRLEVSFERFRDKLRPGAEETFSVVVRGAGDSTLDPAAVELLAYMYDRSLDLFARHAPPNVVDLYPNFLGARAAQTNLGQAPIVWQRHTLPRPSSAPNLLPAVLRYLDGWPIGGPGQRRARLQTMKMATRSRPGMAAPASPLPSPAPQAEAIAVTAEAASDDIAMDLRACGARPRAAAAGRGRGRAAHPPGAKLTATAGWGPP